MGEAFPIPDTPTAKRDSASEPFPPYGPADPIPNPEPAAPSLQQPDPGVYPPHS